MIAYDSESGRVEKNLTFQVLVDIAAPVVGNVSPSEYVILGDDSCGWGAR